MTRDHIEFAESGRQEATPFTRAWYGVWFTMSTAILISGLDPAWEPTISLVTFPDWLSLLVGGFGMVGAAVALFGSWMPPLSSNSWAWESAGVVLQMLGWSAFAIITAWSAPLTVIPWMFGLGSVLALFARQRTLAHRKMFTKTVVEAHEKVVKDVRSE